MEFFFVEPGRFRKMADSVGAPAEAKTRFVLLFSADAATPITRWIMKTATIPAYIAARRLWASA